MMGKKIIIKGSVFYWDGLCQAFGSDRVVKKRIPIDAIQIDEPFSVETMEGKMKGKAGDYLMKGIEGELYPCDKDIFDKSYEVV